MQDSEKFSRTSAFTPPRYYFSSFFNIVGNEYEAIVEFSPFQKVPKKKAKKVDSRKGTIEQGEVSDL